MTNSREKGAAAEREVARILREYGYPARRGQQYCGGNGDADVEGLEGIHIEVKRRESFQLYNAMAQAKHDAREGEIPAVFHRRNNCPWVVILELDDFMRMYRDFEPDVPFADPECGSNSH